MQTHPYAATIRAKKLGVLVRSARLSAGKSVEECAEAIAADRETIESFENGEKSPSLPELEMLAFYLKIPLEYFWGRETALARQTGESGVDTRRLLDLRQRIIGAKLRRARQEAGLSTEKLAEMTNLSAVQITAYELGEESPSLVSLEYLANALGRPLKEFQDNRGRVGGWIKQQRALQNFNELSPDLQDFISKPINRPYLELAQRLSEMDVEKLRAVAEGLLEITL